MRSLSAILFVILLIITIPVHAQSSDKFTTSINGTLINTIVNPQAKVSSENGKFWCTYKIDAVTDEMRLLSDLKLYENGKLILTLNKIAGSDVSITNSGRLIFYDHSEHYRDILKIHSYSKEGNFLFVKNFKSAGQIEFSPSGEIMGVRTPEGISVIQLQDGNYYVIEKGLQFAFSEDKNFVITAPSNELRLYNITSLVKTFSTGMELPRKVVVSSENKIAVIIDKYNLKVFSLDKDELIFSDKLSGNFSYRDLKFAAGKIIAGIHKRNPEESEGIMRVYDLKGNRVEEKSGESRLLTNFDKLNLQKKIQTDYDPVPWPFFPFDSMRTVWNHYEQHMGLGGTDSYLHQGLDLITPIGEPTYSVIDGYVKAVLTTGGDIYWRIAISDTQSAGRSDGWLSAHLIQNTIQFDVGDTVHIHDYLGNIIQWSNDWGHIHFVNISDSGQVWYYNDGEWGINFSPILVLQPYPDVTPPVINNVFTWSKFGFAVNESDDYLQPDSLFGEIDIIVKVVDYAGDSEWQQPAYSTFYSIKRISDGQMIKPRTMGHILNHKYPFYDVSWYMDYAGVMFQRDYTLLPPDWMNPNRNYYHNLTNSNGDSLIELSEKSLAFNTDDYSDGDYRIIIEAYDEAGNSDIDSMDVKFKNGNPVPVELVSFTARTIDKDVLISWTTASEVNNRGFEIQRSINEVDFLTVGFVEGNGTTTEKNNYNFRDKNLISGKYHYRLKQLDFNGSCKISESIEILFAEKFALEQNYPNPFNPVTKIYFSIKSDSKVQLNVYNILGQKVSVILNDNMTAGEHSIEFDASKAGLTSGIYFYTLTAKENDGNNFTATRKMVVLK